MAKYIAYKESGNLINDAVTRCITEGVCNGITSPGTIYTTPVVGNSASINFEGSYLGILDVTNNAQKTGMLILGVSSFSGGGQSFQYPLSTLNDAIYSDKVDRTVLDKSTANNYRSFYFKFPSTITITSDYFLYYNVSSTGTSIDVKYYGIIGNPSNSLLTNQSTISDDLLILPHFTTNGNINSTSINISANNNISFLNYIIEKNSSLLAETSPYTITVTRLGLLSLIDNATLSLKSQLTSKGNLILEDESLITINGANIFSDGQPLNSYTKFLNSHVPSVTSSFKINNSNDILNWSNNDLLLTIPQTSSNIYQNVSKIISLNNDLITTETNINPYLSSSKIKYEYDLINLSSGVNIKSNSNIISKPYYNYNKFRAASRSFNIYGLSNINIKNTTIENFGFYHRTNASYKYNEDILFQDAANGQYLINIPQFAGNPLASGDNTIVDSVFSFYVYMLDINPVLDNRDYYGLVSKIFYWTKDSAPGSSNKGFKFGINGNGVLGLFYFVWDVPGQANTNKWIHVRGPQIPYATWTKITLEVVAGDNYNAYINDVLQFKSTANRRNYFTTSGEFYVGGPNRLVSNIKQYNTSRIIPPDPTIRPIPYEPNRHYYLNFRDNPIMSWPIFNTEKGNSSRVLISDSKIVGFGDYRSFLFNTNTNNLTCRNTIIYNNKIELSQTTNVGLSVINFNNNLLLDSPLYVYNIKGGMDLDNNTYILSKEFTTLEIYSSNIKDSSIINQTIISPLPTTAIKYYYTDKLNNTISLSNIKIYNDVPTSNSNAMLVAKTPGVTYKNPVNITMKDCDITGTVDIYGCNGLVDLKDSIIKQKNYNYTVLYLELSSQNTSINVDNLTCFKGINSASYGLAFSNESWTPFSKPQKITVKNSTIYGGIYYSGNGAYGALTQNCLYNLPQNKDDYSINIFDTKIFNYMDPCRSIWIQDLWPTQVVNISGVQALGGTNRSYYSIYCSQNFTEHPVGGTLLSPYTINIQKCNLNGIIQLEYGLLKYNKFDGSDKNKISGTSFQRILSTNIYNVDCAIEIFNPINPRIHTFIDSLSYTPVNINASDTIKTTFNYPPNPKNTLYPFKLTLKNSVLTAGRLNIDNFYGDITNNIVSLSTFDKNITVGDGPVTIKNNKALVDLLSTNEFIISDNRVNYSYNLNSNDSYSKVEVKSVSSYRLDSINPTTTDIYDNSNFINNRFGFTLASASTGLKYETKTINSGIISLISPAAATSFSTFSLNTKFNFLRFKSVSHIAVRAKMFLNERMIYCGSLISYPNFVINMREFEWDKKDTFHIVMYAPAGYGVTLSAFEYSDNGIEFQPISISDIGFYNKLSHDLITKFKTIHPRKNNRGNYIQLYVDETIDSPEYDNTIMPSLVVNQNIIKTGSNINLTKMDSKYIIDGAYNTANLINPKSTQYFYNGDMTLLNDVKYISAEFDGNLVDTGAPSERVVPRTYLNGGVNHPYRTKSSSKYVALSAGEYAKVFVFVSKSEGYSINEINAPRLMLAKNVALGIEEDIILDKFSNDIMIDKKYIDWILLQGKTPAVTKNGVLEFYVDCSGDNMSGTGFITIDSWSASTDNNIGEYWFSEEGETDWNTV